ncbi:MAG: RsmB/NOP family class I SAM-dependent RNA methyltransferase [Gemmatimonadales bacterium]|nr:MAG: RsmB/NOP family class I SAM-dependent RNA methyltransferase [Gemmatimonadales bacterium]
MGGRRREGRDALRIRGRETLEGYREFVDDWQAFQEAIRRPEPTTLRTNLCRIERPELGARLEGQGFRVEPLPHQPAFLRVLDGPFPISDTLEHWAGLFYIQQAATGWAAPLLDPRPGERVLDLCAAPGGKTTHLAERMQGTGTVVAADVNETRIRALLGNIYRLGHTNIMTVAGDGRRFPLGASFDRVMVDVPCSAEGTLRKRGGMIPGHSRKWAKQVTRAQEKLLRRAAALTRPGGTLLYVTCTFGPHENEAVLTRVLADAPLDVDPVEFPAPHAPGLAGFDGASFDPRLAGAVRIYPHHLDSGGLFLCRLKRLEGPVPGVEIPGGSEVDSHDEQDRAPYGSRTSIPVSGWSPVPPVFPEGDDGGVDVEAAHTEVRRGQEFLQTRLGVAPEGLSEVKWMQRGSNLWVHSLAGWPLENWQPGGHWRAVAVGFRAMDLGGDGPPRPTNDLLGWLGSRISEGRVELSATEWVRLLESGRTQSAPDAGRDGIVALCHDGMVLGRGFQRGRLLRHEIPKGRLRWLRNVMEGRVNALQGEPEEG